MEKLNFMDKYPITAITINKNEIKYSNINEIIEHLKDLIIAHPIATFIQIFDHYAHTLSINGEIDTTIKDAKNLIFCFGASITTPHMVAVRPRSFGICELEDSFGFEFLDAPKDDLNNLMIEWVNSIKK